MADRLSIGEYDAALSQEAKAELTELGPADILIGIPSHRNARTIGEVLDALGQCLESYYRDQRIILLNADGGSSDNTVHLIDEAPFPPNVAKLMTTYEGTTGKGTATRAIFEAAETLTCRACLVLEARAPGIQPEWIKALLDPVLMGEQMTIPCYQRSGYAAALNDNIFYPFVRTFLHTNLRQPLLSEFCVSGRFAAELAEMDVWETDVARYGINVWVAIQALTQNLRVAQVDLGYRGDYSGEPGNPLDARFLHSVGTLFRLLAVNSQEWQEQMPRQVEFVGSRCPDRVLPCEDCRNELLESFREGKDRYGHLWEAILQTETLEKVQALLTLASAEFEFPLALWRDVVLQFALVFNQGDGDPDKVIEALLPLFYGRTVTYLEEAQGLSCAERDALAERIVQAFVQGRPGFEARWDTFKSWDEADSTIYWLT